MKRRILSKKKKWKKTVRILAVSAGTVFLFAVGLFAATFDANDYRIPVGAALSGRLDRDIELNGPVGWSFSFSNGFTLDLSDVVIGNPPWAEESDMARIGRLRLHVDLVPLFEKRLRIVAFELRDADLRLEIASNGARNWEFKPAREATAQADGAGASETKRPVAIRVDRAEIVTSRVLIKGADGKKTAIDVPSLTFEDKGKAVRLHFRGGTGALPVEADLAGGSLDALGAESWPFNFRARAAGASFEGSGALNRSMRNVSLGRLVFSSNETHIEGKLDVSFEKTRPFLSGVIDGKRVDPADLSFGVASDGKDKPLVPSSNEGEKRLFSSEPFDFSALHGVDARVEIRAGVMDLGPAFIENLQTKATLEKGVLTLSPLSFAIGGNEATGRLVLDASRAPPRVSMALLARDAEISRLLRLGGFETALSGRADFDIRFDSSGRSPRDFAAHANGSLSLVMDKGNVSSSALAKTAGQLVQLFAPGVGAALANTGLNCLVARYAIKDGLLETKGFLADTEMTTIMGEGTVNLPDEYLNLGFLTKPKGLASLVPPTKITGPILSPRIEVDTILAAGKLFSFLKDGASPAEGIPDVVPVKGQNACVFALDNPKAAKELKSKAAPARPLVPSGGNVQEKIKDIGNKLIDSLGGGFLKP